MAQEEKYFSAGAGVFHRGKRRGKDMRWAVMIKKCGCPEDSIYLPERLLSRLEEVKSHSLTLLEAPSGFGKTTSFREYLNKSCPGARSFWYTCREEAGAGAWDGICGLVEKTDPAASIKLRALGVPDRDAAAEAASVISGLRCKLETYLVIDNFQLLKTDAPAAIVNAFSLHNSPLLRIVFITQKLYADRTWEAPGILKISADDFLFDGAAIRRFFELAGLRPDVGEIKTVLDASGGWIAAIRLHRMHYITAGEVSAEDSMDDLIESALWSGLPEQERRLLMSLSLFEGFSARQASMMLENSPGKERTEEILEKIPFTPYAPAEGLFYMHSILREFLKRRFECSPRSFRNQAYVRAGRAAEAAGDLFQATKFYLDTGDYESILAMPFTTRFFYNFPDSGVIDLFERLVDECPDETLMRRPIPLIIFSQQFFRDRRTEAFFTTTALLRRVIETPSGLTDEELGRVRGEFYMLMSFTKFNDIAGMSEYHRRAYSDLERLSSPPRSLIFGGDMPWTMSGASVMFLYWRESGRLDKTLSVMDECLPFYVTLAGGHGAGAGFIFRAEAALARGDDEAAEILSRSALYEAGEAGQTGNSLCAWLVLARTAVLRGDGELYCLARKNIKDEAARSAQRSILRIADLCLAYTDLLIGRHDELPSWLDGEDSIARAVYADGRPYALMIRGAALLSRGRFGELRDSADRVIEIAGRMKYLLPLTVMKIFLSAAADREGNRPGAACLLKDALDLALPDMVLMPFAECAELLEPILPCLAENLDSKNYRALLTLFRRQTEGAAAIRRALSGEAALTERQREIALMLKKGLTVKQIGGRLGISENTVKTTKKAIYERIGVHSRAELAKERF